MKTTSCTLAAAIGTGLLLSALSASASTIFSDSFNYTVGQLLEAQTPTWAGLNTGPEPFIASGNLTVSGLAPSTGNMVSWTTGNIREALASYPAQTEGTVFYSFAFRMDQLPTAAAYSFSLAHTNTLYGAAVWLRANGTQFELGLSNRSNSTPSYDTALFDVGATYFLVGSYNLADATSSLWINPSSSSFAGSAPTPTLTATGGTAMTTLSQFLIRGVNGSPAMTMDELRIGTTWAGVTPIPEPSTYAMLFGLLALAGVVAYRRRK